MTLVSSAARRRALHVALFSTAAMILLAVGPGGLRIARASDSAVRIDNFTFNPKVLTVKAGTTVTWTNGDDIPHSIIDKDRKVFRSKVLDTDDTFSFTFTDPGTYDYFCSLHPHMTAEIVVTP